MYELSGGKAPFTRYLENLVGTRLESGYSIADQLSYPLKLVPLGSLLPFTFHSNVLPCHYYGGRRCLPTEIGTEMCVMVFDKSLSNGHFP